MANQAKVVSWLFRNAHVLKPKIERLTWAENLLPNVFDIKLQIEVEGVTWTGVGTSICEEVALSKALAEALERAVMQEYQFENSNGIAAHVTYDLAAQTARNELIERDIILSHFYTGTSLKRVSDRILIDAGLISIVDWFKAVHVDVKLFSLGGLGYACLFDGRKALTKFGFLIGSGVKRNEQESVWSAVFEAARSAHKAVTDDVLKNLSLKEFETIENPSFANHGQLAFDFEYANTINFLFSEDESFIQTYWPPHSLVDFELTIGGEIMKECPLKFARVTSVDSQVLFSGKPTLQALNLDRLSKFARRPITWNNVVKLPHPIA